MWKEGIQKGIKDLEAIKKIIVDKYPETAKHERIIWHGSWKPVKNALHKGIELVMKPPQASEAASSTPPSDSHKVQQPSPTPQHTSPSTPPSPEVPPPASTSIEAEGEAPLQDGPPDPVALYDFIRPLLSKGVTYTSLATQVGTNLGKQYSALLKQIASSIEAHRKKGLNSISIHPLLESEFGHQFASMTLALCKLPLSSDRTFPPKWKSMILCSKPKGAGKGGGSEGGSGGEKELTESSEEGDDNPLIEGVDQTEQLKLAQMGSSIRVSEWAKRRK